MEIVVVILAGVVGLAGGIWGGLKVGERFRGQRSWKYWGVNLLAFAVCVVALIGAGFTQQAWIWTLVMAAFAGLITGLKYGYGQSVGLWRSYDRLMRNDEDLRD